MAREHGIPCLFTIHNIHTVKTNLAQVEDRGIDAAYFWQNLYYEKMATSYEQVRDSNPVDLLTSGIFGAHFVNVVSPTFLNEIVREKNIATPSNILDKLGKKVVDLLQQEEGDEKVQADGMDISICVIDFKKEMVQIASANHYVIAINNGELQIIQGDIYSIGGMFGKSEDVKYTNHKLPLSKDLKIYMHTDGFQDQFGGPNNSKFLVSRFEQLIDDNHERPMIEQLQIFEDTLENWKGRNRQIDDILVLGFSFENLSL
ncbi:MAG: hypothetical protein C0594_00720 [Marinilabiliales bacterium]|nr:MAG: hypothetical protein C0594_00720 [Marinilabiliales bacterium]